MAAQFDIARLARAALSSAPQLLAAWLPGGRVVGGEYKAKNPTRDDRKAGSFSVSIATGQWADFATDDRGGDLVSLAAYLRGVTQLQAARALADELGVIDAPVSAAPAPKARTEWVPIAPVPHDAGAWPVAHPVRGRPSQSWCYQSVTGETLGFVYRFETSTGGKEILPLVYAERPGGARAWRWMQWTQPRPIYGQQRLVDGLPVLIVEGEKCADAAHAMLAGQWACVSWPGGGKAVGKVDWSLLAGRRVLIWPDCDAQTDGEGATLPEARQPGVVAAEAIAGTLVGIGCDVRVVSIPAPGAAAPGWDVADAIEGGCSHADLVAMLAVTRAPACTPAQPAPGKAAAPARPAAALAGDWGDRLLRRKGEVDPCLANLVIILGNDPAWSGVLGFDLFSMRITKRLPVPGHPAEAVGEWTDADTSAVRIWLTTEYRVVAGPQDVDAAIEVVARAREYHPVREQLDAIAWDGVARLDGWLADYLGADDSEYTRRVARWFLIAMIARVRRPGIKFDYCLVIEGSQGLRKSSALRVLAGEHFSDTELDLANKDAMSAIRGKWLHEFAEMGSLARAENTRQKSFLSRQVDEFRPTYARREIRCPRQLVFAGTTNDWMWNKDATGGRRFWPVEVRREIDTDGLALVRDQLLAEADARYQAGERYWPTADEQRRLFDPEQLQREAEDGLFDQLHDWIEQLTRPEFTMGDVMTEALRLDAGRITRDITTRVGTMLKKLGCGRREKRNGVSRFVYTLPDWAAYTRAEAARVIDGGEHASSLPI